jgi:hypothetical protein
MTNAFIPAWEGEYACSSPRAFCPGVPTQESGVAAQPDALPADKQRQEVVREDDEEHVPEEEVHEEPIPCEAELAPHVVEAVHHD